MSFSRWLGIKPSSTEPVPLVLYTRASCPLCDVMKAEIERARLEQPTTLEIVDIESDPALVELYENSIPVLTIGGRVAFKGRLTALELARKMRRWSEEAPRG